MILCQPTDTDVPLTLSLSSSLTGPILGMTCTVAIRNGQTSTSYLDFSDMTFKVAGWVTKRQTLTELGAGSPGVYVLSGGLDISAITNLPTTTHQLIAEYEIDSPVVGVVNETIVLVSDVYTGIELIRKVTNNRLEINFATQRLILFDDDGVTILRQWALSTDGGEAVTTNTGVQTKRGVPI